MTDLMRSTRVAILAALVCGFTNSTLAEAMNDKKSLMEVKVEKAWNGSVMDAGLAPSGHTCITNAKAFETLWKAWKIEGNVPEVDFKTHLLIIGTSGGSTIRPNLLIDDEGDLKMFFSSNRDLKPGFRYIIVSVKKEGVKSVDGQPLKE